MAKISVDSLLGNLQSQSTKTSGILKQIDLKTDNNIRKASMLNVSLDGEEEELLNKKSKGIFDFMLPKESMEQKPQQQKFGNVGLDAGGAAGATDAGGGGAAATTAGGQQEGGGLGSSVLAAGGLALGTMGTDAINNMFGTPSGEGQQPGGDSIDYVAPGKVTPVVTGRYGEQRKTGAHGGTDLAVNEGTPLRAISDGKIIDAGVDPGGWGNFVVFVDDKGIHHLYGHVQNGYRGEGDIKKGDIIARVGMTGRTTGPHLHWETGTRWTGGVLTGKFDPLNRYSMHAPFSTAKAPSASTQAKPAPSAPTTPTALQPASRPSAAAPSGQPSGVQSSQRVSSSSSPTYRGSAERSSATYQQGLS